MSDNNEKSTSNRLEAMVVKMFRYQQREKYWKVAKFLFLSFLIAAIGFSVMRQINRALGNNITRSSTQAAELTKEHVALIDLKGDILGSFDSEESSTSDRVIHQLRRAFKNPKVVAIALRINSPGGSGVQSSQIYEEIQYLRTQYPKVPIYAVCEEMCASAAYHIASACSYIYAGMYSISGSIGVLYHGFGYVEALKKLGIENRVITAGKHKSFLNPYAPLQPEEVALLKEIQAEMHKEFIEDVKAGRGDRLKNLEQNAEVVFSGRVWTAKQALALGLIDGIGSLHSVLRNVIKVEKIVNYTSHPDWLTQFKKLIGGHSPMNSSQQRGPILAGAHPLLGLVDPLLGLGSPVSGLV
jgi:protease-4